MKTERRHELKHNSLDAELVKVLDYLKKHAKGISLTILGIVAAISVATVVIRNRAHAISAPRAHYDHLKTLNIFTTEGRTAALKGFEELADQDGNEQVAALACVEAGDICVRQQMTGDPAPGSRDRARKHYQRVVNEFGDFPLATGRAYLGLARLAEGDGKFAAAREHYQRVVGLGARTSVLAVNAAKKGLAALSDLEKPIRLATTRPVIPIIEPDPPTTQPATAPSTAPATAPTTQPATAPSTAPTTRPATVPITTPTTQPATAP